MASRVLHPASRRRPRSRASVRGMTLIEIGIALAIVMLMMFVAVPSIEAFMGVHAREEAGRVSGAIRFMYGQSALSGKVCRIVFDMDERSWWPECTEGRFTVEREKERSRGGQRLEDKKRERKADTPPRDDAESMRQRVERKAEFSELSSEDVHKRKLPDGANLAVWTGHQREKYSKGKAFLYFFPQGNTERAQIYVSSDHGDVYTLVVSPLNGHVRVEGKEIDVPRE